VQISLIAAASANGIIGADGTLPWHLPDDFRWFKARTLGKPVVMGRRTWESLDGPLPGRRNIVISRRGNYLAPGAEVVNSPEAAIKVARGADELMVIGGGEIFRQFLPWTDRIYLTRVDAEINGDVTFPAMHPTEWTLVAREAHAADERHAYPFEFRVYERGPGRSPKA
jgi:dihydrofolate reductase